MVFQQLSLFPHMTALQNVTETLVHVLRLGKDEAHQRAADLLSPRARFSPVSRETPDSALGNGSDAFQASGAGGAIASSCSLIAATRLARSGRKPLKSMFSAFGRTTCGVQMADHAATVDRR